MKGYTRAFFIVSLIFLPVAAVLHFLTVIGMSGAWAAMVHLTLFGWITGMIYAVNYHTMPVFSGRDFPYPWLIQIHWLVFTLGLPTATAGLLLGVNRLIAGGLLFECIAAFLFVANTVLLFVRGLPRPHRPPAPPIADQAQVDRVGTQATKLAGVCLPLALLLLLAHPQWLNGLWVLAAEHLAALGWVMLMIVGVAYHVLPRFSGRAVRGVTWARAQLLCHTVALALIVVSLGFGWSRLFALGGVLMTLAVGLFIWTVWPTLRAIDPHPAAISVTLKEYPR